MSIEETQIDPKNKIIHFFHYKKSNQTLFNAQDEDYCTHTGQIYPYTIRYYTINESLSSLGLNKLIDLVKSISTRDPEKNQVLFYARVPTVSFDILFVRNRFRLGFLSLLKHLRNYIRGMSAFFDVPLSEQDYYYISRRDLQEYQIVLKKFLNIFETSGKPSNVKIARIKDQIFDVKMFNGTTNEMLICNSWFSYFSDVAFGCIKGRLLQMSGTCYLNAIVNGFILTPTARKIALEKMRGIERAKYTKPINVDICERKDEYYFFRLLYNIICSGVNIRESAYKKDIMIEYSKIYSSDIGGQGGDIYNSLRKLLGIIDPKYIDLSFRIDEETFEQIFEEQLRSDGDFLIVHSRTRTEKSFNSKFLENADKFNKLVFNGDTFSLAFVVFTYLFADGESHAVVGIKCDDNYMLVDSNVEIIDIDWRYIYRDLELNKNLKQMVSRLYQLEVVNIFNHPVFIRQSTIDKYEKITSRELCENL